MSTQQGRVELGRGNLTGYGRGSLFCLVLVAAGLPPEDEEMTVLPTVRVVGSSEEGRRPPGSAASIDYSESLGFSDWTADDVHSVLRQIPGVAFRQEDGYGLFPNLSLRGVDSARSAKVTMMEDGILVAPAPYSAPAAYYAPTAGRMVGIEILKGSSQVLYGPHITGGVINYLSTPIPLDRGGSVNTLYGADNEIRTHLYWGATTPLGEGVVGYLVEGWLRRTDGFKAIDQTPDFVDTGDTGFLREDLVLKIMWEPDFHGSQLVELTYGSAETVAKETYLGLTDNDFAADSTRRYAASRFDEFEALQQRVAVRHTVDLGQDRRLSTTAYWTEFDRDWFKLKDLRNVEDAANPGTFDQKQSLSNALGGGNGGNGLDCLRAVAACTLRYRHNTRAYETKGVEVGLVAPWGDERNFEIRARYHVDSVRRNQEDIDFAQDATGVITGQTSLGQGSGGDRDSETEALALAAQASMAFGALTIVPGVRVERLNLNHVDFNLPPGDQSFSDTLDVWGGGIGFTWDGGNESTWFGGLHRGFSTPSPRAAAKDGIKEETSLGVELGWRMEIPAIALAAQVVGFSSAFDNLIVINNVGGGGSGESENVGRVDSYGLEVSIKADPASARGRAYRNPWFLALTLTETRLANDSSSTDPESIFSGGERGNRVPYMPVMTVSAGVAWTWPEWGVSVQANWVDETFTNAANATNLVNPGTGDPDVRFGKTDALFVVDLAGHWNLGVGVRLRGGIKNLFDEVGVVSRHPHGARPNLPLAAFVALEIALP